jgi:predicted Zn finger-like uncharacterized protein
MAHEQYTRCPSCSTIFRVTPEQLALRGGQVRCGHCRTVFDGTAHLISLAPQPRPQGAEPEADELLAGPPTVTLRSAQALRPALEEAAEAAGAESGAAPAAGSPAAAVANAASAVRGEAAAAATARTSLRDALPHRPGAAPKARREEPEDEEEVDYDSRFAWDRPRRQRPLVRALCIAAIPILVLALIAQALYHFRDAIAAHWPVTRPALSALCSVAGCTVRPLRDIGALSIDASDLQADPAHKGLLILSATLRNRAGYAVAYPYLELTLTDASDQVVVRRALPPAEFAGGTADLTRGIAANGEVVVRLFIDASATSQAGYRLYLFYP